MRVATSLAGVSVALIMAMPAMAQSQHEGHHAAAAGEAKVVFPAMLKVGLTLIDSSGRTVGKITKVDADASGAVTHVEYTPEGGPPESIDPRKLSYSGGPIAVLVPEL